MIVRFKKLCRRTREIRARVYAINDSILKIDRTIFDPGAIRYDRERSSSGRSFDLLYWIEEKDKLIRERDRCFDFIYQFERLMDKVFEEELGPAFLMTYVKGRDMRKVAADAGVSYSRLYKASSKILEDCIGEETLDRLCTMADELEKVK